MKSDLARLFPELPHLAYSSDGLEAHAMDGSQGTNRATAEKCQITALNDYEAVQCWLREYQSVPTTFRSYQKEAERLLLWCIYQRKKPLSSLMRDDFEAYFHFLSDPQPSHFWCGPKGGNTRRRGQSHWKPFEKGLSSSAKATAISIIQSLLRYLVIARYLASNPLDLMRLRQRHLNSSETRRLQILERILNEDEWLALIEALDAMPELTQHEKEEKIRTRCLIALLYFLGIRVNELATHTWAAFRQVQGDWWFFLVGKGNKPGRIPVNDELLNAIAGYRQVLRLTPLPQPDDEIPLIISWRTGKGLSARQINRLVKKLSLQAAQQFGNQPHKKTRFEKFSSHWLRHQSATHQDQAGIDITNIKENHRHSDIKTTFHYIHARDKARHAQMQKLTLRPETNH